MTAVLTTSTPAPWHDLRPARRSTTPAPPRLRVLEGGPAAVRAQRRAARAGVRPLTVVAGLVVAALVALALVGLATVLGAGAAATGPAPTAAVGTGAATVAPGTAPADEVVVRAGDTLWSIAGQLRPDGDVRPVVDELARRAGGVEVVPGQRIDVRGLG